MKYSDAYLLAEKYIQLLKPFCLEGKCLIAGSIRRRKPIIGDIEIVLLPDHNHKSDPVSVDLFETKHEPKLFDVLRTLGTLQGRCEITSRQVKISLDKNMVLDVYIPQEHDFYRMYAIRTGNWVYSHEVIGKGWRELGWVGTREGLRRQDQCTRIGRTWKCTHDHPTLPPVWKSEEEFFQYINVPMIPPEEREMSVDYKKPPMMEENLETNAE